MGTPVPSTGAGAVGTEVCGDGGVGPKRWGAPRGDLPITLLRPECKGKWPPFCPWCVGKCGVPPRTNLWKLENLSAFRLFSRTMFKEALQGAVEGTPGGYAGLLMDFEGIPVESYVSKESPF